MFKKVSFQFMLFFILLIISSVLPIRISQKNIRFDLIFHFLYFFIFALFTEKKEEKILILIIPVLMELLQFFLPYRDFDFFDLIFDYLGILTGFFIYKSIIKTPEKRFKFVGSCFGIGIFLPAWKGTFTSFLTLLFLIFFPFSKLTLTFLLIYVYFLHLILKDFLKGKDPSYFTLDELAGTLPAFYLTTEPFVYIIFFFFFRFFDIKKPLFIKNLEKIKGPNGVFLDDFVSGVYAFLIILFIHSILKKIHFIS